MTNAHYASCSWSLHLHWFRVTMPRARLRAVMKLLGRHWGIPEDCKGRWFYEQGARFQSSVLVMHSPSKPEDEPGTLCVDIPGSALDELMPCEKFELCQTLSLGARITRIDLALDGKHPERVGLLDAVLDSCEAGELVDARRWRLIKDQESGALCGRGVTMGVRGKNGSGRFGRVYDKGLESLGAPAGQHERYEVEFTGDAANQVAAHVLASFQTFERRCLARIFGAFDFREKGTTRHLDRRERCQWFADLIGQVHPEPTYQTRTPTNLDRYAKWVREQVIPTAVRLAADTGKCWKEVFQSLIGESPRSRPRDARAKQFERAYREAMEDFEAIPVPV